MFYYYDILSLQNCIVTHKVIMTTRICKMCKQEKSLFEIVFDPRKRCYVDLCKSCRTNAKNSELKTVRKAGHKFPMWGS